jgi:hypothetical protein
LIGDGQDRHVARRTGPAISDFLAGEIFQFTHRRIGQNVPEGIHAGDLRAGDFDRRFFDKCADDRQRAGAQSDLRIAGNDCLDVLAAAASEHGIDVDVILAVEAFFLRDVDRQRDGEQYTVRHDDDDLGARRGGPRRRRKCDESRYHRDEKQGIVF